MDGRIAGIQRGRPPEGARSRSVIAVSGGDLSQGNMGRCIPGMVCHDSPQLPACPPVPMVHRIFECQVDLPCCRVRRIDSSGWSGRVPQGARDHAAADGAQHEVPVFGRVRHMNDAERLMRRLRIDQCLAVVSRARQGAVAYPVVV